MKQYLIVTFITIFFLSACLKKRVPVITIYKPTNGEVFIAPHTIEISGEIYDSDAVLTAYITVTKVNAANDTILDFRDHSILTKYSFNQSFISEPHSNYKICITTLGHSTWVTDSLFVSTQ